MKFQNYSMRKFIRHDMCDVRTDNPEAICPLNFDFYDEAMREISKLKHFKVHKTGYARRTDGQTHA